MQHLNWVIVSSRKVLEKIMHWWIISSWFDINAPQLFCISPSHVSFLYYTFFHSPLPRFLSFPFIFCLALSPNQNVKVSLMFVFSLENFIVLPNLFAFTVEQIDFRIYLKWYLRKSIQSPIRIAFGAQSKFNVIAYVKMRNGVDSAVE